MNPEIVTAAVTAAAPFLVVVALLRLGRRAGERRAATIARQIALTDEIHRELGAAAAPVVRRGWWGVWTVAMAVPIEREATVGALVRIAHELFARLDGVGARKLRIVLSPREPSPRRLAARGVISGEASGKFARALARLG